MPESSVGSRKRSMHCARQALITRSFPASPRPASPPPPPAPAAPAGIPLTRRHTSRRVQFITGTDVTGQLPADLNFAALADPDSTTVVYMGKRTFPALAAKLIEHGMSPETPALLAESLGHADEKLARMTIAKLAGQLAQGFGRATAVILFGALAGDER